MIIAVPTIRRVVFTALTALCIVSTLAVGPASAAVDTDAEQRFLELVNAVRAEAGVAPVEVAADLVEVARRHSARMAAQVLLHHNPTLGEDVADWQKVGENVGRGPRVQPIHDAFVASEGHRRNILDTDWTQVGIGVHVVDGRVWVTQVFREPLATTAPTAANTATTATQASTAPSTAPAQAPASTAPSTAPATRPTVTAPSGSVRPRVPAGIAPRLRGGAAGPAFDHTASILARIAGSLAAR